MANHSAAEICDMASQNRWLKINERRHSRLMLHSRCGETTVSGGSDWVPLLNSATLLHSGEWIMAVTKLSSREFNQDTSRAKRAAKRGPVFITDRGRPSHVLLTVEEYQRITGGQKSVADLLAMPSASEIEFEPPRQRGNLHKSADLT